MVLLLVRGFTREIHRELGQDLPVEIWVAGVDPAVENQDYGIGADWAAAGLDALDFGPAARQPHGLRPRCTVLGVVGRKARRGFRGSDAGLGLRATPVF